MWFILLIFIGCSHACQHHMRPVYNVTNRQYVSCNAWEPECASGTVCQLASREWKTRLNVNADYTLFLCCGEDTEKEFTKKPDSPLDWEQKTKSHIYTNANLYSQSTKILPTNLNGKTGQLAHMKGSEVLHDKINYAPGGSWNDQHQVKQPNSFENHQFQQPMNPLRVERPTSSPLLPPVPQIILPGNGLKYENPRVTQLVTGQITAEAADGTFKLSGTSALIQDNGLNILVDTSSAQNKNKLTAALAQQGLKPQNIQIIIYTNAHPSHIGNDNMFPYAEKIFATFVYKGDEWLAMKQFKEANVRLTQNVEIWRTPGRSEFHNSVIVRNVPSQGSVAVSGNVFLNEASNDDPNAWSRFAMDKELLTQVRNMLYCQVDHIIPAYGTSFAVSSEKKNSAGCSKKVYRRPTVWLKRFRSK